MTATPATGPLRKRRPAAAHPTAAPAPAPLPDARPLDAPLPHGLPLDAPRPAAPLLDAPLLEPRPDEPLPDDDPGRYLEQGARMLGEQLPTATLERLTHWRRAPAPWLELTGLPQTDADVPTPRAGFCDEALLRIPNLVHFGLLRLLGLEPVAYRWENHGRLVRNVAPSAGAARSQTSWGYATGLDWHTDDSVLDHHPDGAPEESIPHFLSFYGMRNTERVPTWLLPVDEVLADLPATTATALRQPAFDVTAPESYGAASEPCGGRPAAPPVRSGVPILWTLPDGHTGVRYGPGRVTGRTAAAQEALTRFAERVAACKGVPIMVEAGGFHVFDNRRVMHRRLPFEPAAPDHARWLRRCYARTAAA